MAGPFCAMTRYLRSAINSGTEWACTYYRNHTQGLPEEHTAPVLSKDTSDKASPLHKLFVQPDPSHMCTKVWPEAMVQLISGITFRKTKAALIGCSHPTSHWQALQVQNHAARGHKPLPPTKYPMQFIPWKNQTPLQRFRHQTLSVQVHVTNEPSATISAAIKQLWPILASQSFLSSYVLSWSIGSNSWILQWSNCQQTLALRTKAGKICFCFVFSENLISLPALPKKAPVR